MSAVAAESRARVGQVAVRSALAASLALGGLVLGAPRGQAATTGAACAKGTGVTVVVQWQSTTTVKCAKGSPANALAALTSAGFTTTRASLVPGYFLCRVNGNPSTDPCKRAAPAKAYWAFFHAPAGGKWVYSTAGVATYRPAKGSVIGLRFGSGSAPAVAPPK